MAVPFWLPGQRKYAHSAQLKFLLKTTKMHTTGGVKLIYDDFETIGFSFLPMSVYFKDVHTLCYWNVNRKSCESHFTTFSFFLLFDSRKSDVVKRVKNLELDTIKTTISRLYKIPVKTSWKTLSNYSELQMFQVKGSSLRSLGYWTPEFWLENHRSSEFKSDVSAALLGCDLVEVF